MTDSDKKPDELDPEDELLDTWEDEFDDEFLDEPVFEDEDIEGEIEQENSIEEEEIEPPPVEDKKKKKEKKPKKEKKKKEKAPDVLETMDEEDDMEHDESEEDAAAPIKKKKKSALGPLIILCLLGGGGFYAYTNFLVPQAPPAPENTIPVVKLEEPEQQNNGSDLLDTPTLPAPEQAQTPAEILEEKAAMAEQHVIKLPEQQQEAATPTPPQLLDSGQHLGEQGVLTPMPEAFDELPVELADLEKQAELQAEVPAPEPMEMATAGEEKTEAAPLIEDELLSKTETIFEQAQAAAAKKETNEIPDFLIKEEMVTQPEAEPAPEPETPEIAATPMEEKPPVNDAAIEEKTAVIEETPILDMQEKGVQPEKDVQQEPKQPEPPSKNEENVAVQPQKKPEKPPVIQDKKPVETAKSPVTMQKTAKQVKEPEWIIRAAQSGKAVIFDRNTTEMRSVEVGDIVNGIGRIKSIGKQGKQWVIQGTLGKIQQ